MTRRSYRALLRLPAFGLYDERGRIVAAVRAATAQDARELFRRHGLQGVRVRRLSPG